MRVISVLDYPLREKGMERTGKTRELFFLSRGHCLCSAPELTNALLLGKINQFCRGFLLGQTHIYSGRPDHSIPSIQHNTKGSRVHDSTTSNNCVILRAGVTETYRA
jgi:hypothetical protein